MPDIVPERTDDDSALNRSGQLETVKCTVIGDGAIGKTSLIVSYTTNDYPQDYKPTVHDFYTGKFFYFTPFFVPFWARVCLYVLNLTVLTHMV